MQVEHLTDEQISDLIDALLDSHEREDVERHVRSCAACAARVERTRGAVSLVRRLPRVVPPRTFVLPIGDALRPVPPKATARGPWSGAPLLLRCGASLAAALMVIIFVADASRPQPQAVSTAGGAAAGGAPSPVALLRAAEAPSPVDAAVPAESSARAFRAPSAPAAVGSAANQAPASQLSEQAPAQAGASAPAPTMADGKAATERERRDEAQSRPDGGRPSPVGVGTFSIGQIGGFSMGLLAVILALASIAVQRRRRIS